MALSEENGVGTTMLVSPTSNGMPYPYPVYSGGNGGGNNGFGDGNGWWIVLLIILLAAGNGFGNNGNNGFGGQPIIVNDGNGGSVQRGFDQAAIMGGINGLQSGVQGISTQLCNCCADVQSSLCNGFAGVNSNIANGFAQSEIADNARQMANMNQAFSNQMAMNQGFNQLSSQFADCCCENRLGLANLGSDIAREACADRAAVSDALRDVIAANTASTQRILDQMCNDKIDAKNEKIADLERQLTMANLAASQTAQTGRILADNAAQTVALEQYLNPVPVPAYVVQNPNCCQNTCGCGC